MKNINNSFRDLETLRFQSQELLEELNNIHKNYTLRKIEENEAIIKIKVSIKNYVKSNRKTSPSERINISLDKIQYIGIKLDAFDLSKESKKIDTLKCLLKNIVKNSDSKLSNDKFEYIVFDILFKKYKQIIFYTYILLGLATTYAYLHRIQSTNLFLDSITSFNYGVLTFINLVYFVIFPVFVYFFISPIFNFFCYEYIDNAILKLETKIKNIARDLENNRGKLVKNILEFCLAIIFITKPLILTVIVYILGGSKPDTLILSPYHLFILMMIELFFDKRARGFEKNIKAISFIIYILIAIILILGLLSPKLNDSIFIYLGIKDKSDKTYIIDSDYYKTLNSDIQNLYIGSITKDLKFYKNLNISCGKIVWKTGSHIVFNPEGSSSYYQIPKDKISLFQKNGIYVDNIFKPCGNNER